MRNGWTGGQYSLWRFGFGIWILFQFAALAPAGRPVLGGAGAAAAVLLAVGLLDRAASAGALLGLAASWWRLGAIPPTGSLLLGWLLLAHAASPRAPFGSFAARGRIDPAGGWRLPAWIHLGTWAALLAAAAGTPRGGAGAFVWAALLAFDPRWIPPRPAAGAAGRETIFFDGTCGLCHRTVRFVLAEERGPDTFDFAPLASEAFRKALGHATGLPDSVVLLAADGRPLVRSAAALRVLARLGGWWRLIAAILRAVPAPLLDRSYDALARVRRRLFRRPAAACPALPPRLRARFRA
jgi:predicted DCC family thiol-disulfide oxidoreductase YuxK